MGQPWQHRINQTDFNEYPDFVTKWLTDPSLDPTLPTIAIINGWQAVHNENQWIADLHKNSINHFAYDSRGQGASPKNGRLDAVQNAIDANEIIKTALDNVTKLANKVGKNTGNLILQGHCIGTMTIAALFAGNFPISKITKGVILLSPVSTFALPIFIKALYFLPKWFGTFSINYIAPSVMSSIAPGDKSDHSRDNAMTRLQRLDHDAALRQVKDMLWKENVSEYWQIIDVPALILVGKHDPLVKYEDSIHPFDSLKYPIWFELEAPDHLLLESNTEIISEIIPEFCEDPVAFYNKYKSLRPKFD